MYFNQVEAPTLIFPAYPHDNPRYNPDNGWLSWLVVTLNGCVNCSHLFCWYNPYHILILSPSLSKIAP